MSHKWERFRMPLDRKVRFSAVCLLFLVCVSVQIRADGLPGEYLLTQRWRGMIAQHSPLTNPALMTEENYVSVRAAFAPVLDGAFLLGEIGAVIPVGLYQSLGISCLGEFDGDVTGGTIKIENIEPILSNDSSTSSNNNLLVAVSYAWHFWNRFSAGANVKIAYQSNFGNPKRGLGLDLGLSYRLGRSAVFGDHVIGLSFINLIQPAMGDAYSLTFNKEGSYSRNLKFSWLGNYWEHRFETAFDFDIKDILVAAEEFRAENGVNLAKSIEWDANLQLSTWLLRLIRTSIQVGFDENALDYWGFVVGMNVPAWNNGRDLDFLYQYTIMTEDDNDATSHTFNLRMDYGKHREEIFARRMARLASLSPNELYNKARKLYSEGKFWDAFFIFTRISVEFPDFFKNDWVEYFRASCQEEMDMRMMAIKNYEQTKKGFPLSSVVPHADLGLMRVYYRNGEFAKVSQQFNELNKPNVQDSLRFHAVYLQGQAYLQSNESRKAIELFSIVPDLHPDYVYAQHALAVGKAQLGSEFSEIVPHLENVIGSKPVTNGQKEIINRSYVFLGYIFYEENAVSKAVVSMRMVPTTSYYAEDALLGQGWTALKAHQWNDCILIGQMLSNTSKKTILQCEGMLIEAYGYLLQKDYGQALAVLNKASNLAATLKLVDKDSLNLLKMQYESDRESDNYLADNIDNYAKVSYANEKASKTDSLRLAHQDYLTKFHEYSTFSMEFERASFFSRNVDAVVSDIEYALATVQKIAGSSNLLEEQQKLDAKQQEIDKEIEQLKKEMEKLQK